MIDEKVLVERLEETEKLLLENSVSVDCTIGIVNFAERAKNIVNQLAEESNLTPCYLGSPCEYQNENIRIEESNNGWIPCSERLPEEDDRVLLQDYKGYITVETCRTYKGIKGFDDEDWWSSASNYLAWQSLPAPYVPKEDKQK